LIAEKPDPDGELTDIHKVEKSILTSIKESQTPAETETTDAALEIDAEDFGPIHEEPQFFPEAVIPMEFIPVETEARSETDEIENPEATVAETTVALEIENIPDFIFEPVSAAKPETPEDPALLGELAKQKLDIGKPLEFSKDETHSFQEWLQLSRLKPIERDEMVAEATIAKEEKEKSEDTGSDKIKKSELIDRFIENNPKIPQIKGETKPPAITEIKEDHSSLMTETLARVYLEQKKYQKAIQAYEILILKYPEKSSFFADRISEIKNLQQNNPE
jgi:hypothetical protein